MILTIVTIAVSVVLFMVSQWWWKSHLNPVTVGIVAWTPGLIMLNWPPYFLHPYYIHLNRPIVPEFYLALAMAFFAFWAGCASVKLLSAPGAFAVSAVRSRVDFSVPRALIFFAAGFVVFVYLYLNSGLLGFQQMDTVGVAESRMRLSAGPVSLMILFMDVAAIAMFVRFLQERGGLINLLPMIVAMLCQAATFQKSRFMFLVMACIFLAAIHPRESYHLFLRNSQRRALVIGLVLIVFLALFAMNQARGIAVVQMTASSSPILEQVYIYSGAAAMQNVSVTIEGYLPFDNPAMGAYLARPILWHFVDRDIFFVSRYLGGINASTYLIYAWADFRWLGFFIHPFLLGVLIMNFLRSALRGRFIGLVLGVIAMHALMYSSNTDVMFDPTTLIVAVIGIMAWIFTYPLEGGSLSRPALAPSGQFVPSPRPPDRGDSDPIGSPRLSRRPGI